MTAGDWHQRRLQLSMTLPSWADEPDELPPWTEIRQLARQAEEIGVDAIFVADHSGFDRPDGCSTEFRDGWTLLPALAEVTSQAAIGTLVSTPLLRHPVALARMACTLDEMSGGRVILGLGTAGPIERAVHVLGLSPQHLYSRFEEAIRIIAPLLHDGSIDFHGQHFEAHEARLGPAGPRQGRIPIWIGARGPKMLRLVARWADAVNFQPPLSTPNQARSLVARFEQACHEVGRDPATIEKTGWAMVSFTGPDRSAWDYSIAGDPGQIAAQMHSLADSGITHLSCYVETEIASTRARTFPVITSLALERMSEVIQALRAVEATD